MSRLSPNPLTPQEQLSGAQPNAMQARETERRRWSAQQAQAQDRRARQQAQSPARRTQRLLQQLRALQPGPRAARQLLSPVLTIFPQPQRRR